MGNKQYCGQNEHIDKGPDWDKNSKPTKRSKKYTKRRNQSENLELSTENSGSLSQGRTRQNSESIMLTSEQN